MAFRSLDESSKYREGFIAAGFSLRGKDEKMGKPTNKSVDKLGSNDILRLVIRNYAFCD
ncbi:MAG: hypothetical protein KAW52_07535 [candidate division Zixibacteria bacterium]|nr:hypothetical protein [candidate division Zixibacteria bacterium]